MLIRHAHNFKHRMHKPGTGFAITYGPIASGATQTTVTVDWSLSIAATGQVHYGTTIAYGSTSTLETSYLFAHSQALSGLSAGTTYHYKVVSETAEGETIESPDFTFTTQAAAGGSYPTPSALVYTAQSAMSLPAYLGTGTDPDHGTEVARVGQNHLDRQHYSSTAAWNCDGTLFAINFGSGHEKLFDTTTTPWTLLNGSASIFAGDMSWDDTNPLRFYRQSAPSSIARYTVNASTGAISFDTSWTVGGGSHSSISLGGGQGQQAGNYVPYVYDVQSGGHYAGYGCLNVSTGSYWEEDFSGADVVDCSYVTQDGQYYVVMFDTSGTGSTQGGWAMNASDGSNKRNVTSSQTHLAMCERTNGNQVIVGYMNGGVAMVDLDNSDTQTQLVDYWPGGHFSGRNILRPGYVYISNGLSPTYSPPATYAGKQDIFAVALDDPPSDGGDVEYYAKQHAPDPRLNYNYDPMACASPDGTMVAWGRTDGSSVYGCVAGVDTGM